MTPNAEARIEQKLDSLLDLTARMDERLIAATNTLEGHDAAIVAERARVDTEIERLANRVVTLEARGRFTWSDIVKLTVPITGVAVAVTAIISLVIK